MEGGAAATLRERKRALSASIAEATREARRLKTQLRRTTASAARAWVLPEYLRRVVLIVHLLAHGVSEPAMVFLQQAGRQRHWPHRSDDELESLINWAVLAASVEELVALGDMEAPSDPAAMATAVDLVEQWRVACWTRAQNLKGVAPSTTVVLGEFERGRAGLPAALRVRSWGTSAEAAARKRASRWRRRWGGRIGALRAREEVSVAEMREKAGTV